jgi:hypothetical protein
MFAAIAVVCSAIQPAAARAIDDPATQDQSLDKCPLALLKEVPGLDIPVPDRPASQAPRGWPSLGAVLTHLRGSQ